MFDALVKPIQLYNSKTWDMQINLINNEPLNQKFCQKIMEVANKLMITLFVKQNLADSQQYLI